MKKTTFIADNGVKVTGILIMESKHDITPTKETYSELIYAQNRLIKIHHRLDWIEDELDEVRKPKIEIISEYVVIPELDKLLEN